jgi:putative SOS response-associated peptidase YedK
MPVILKPGDYERWLTRKEARPPLHLLRSYDAEAMQAVPFNQGMATIQYKMGHLVLSGSGTF